MNYHAPTRTKGIITNFPILAIAKWVLVAGVLVCLALAGFGCASARLQPTETLVRDTTTLRTVQRLVSVAVPGDSAKLSTRVVYDEATGRFQPVTIFSAVGRTRLAFVLNAYGQVTISALAAPYVAQVAVTDTDRSHTRITKEKETVAVKAPKSRFVKFCIWFTIGAIAVIAGGAYLKFFTPLRFLSFLK